MKYSLKETIAEWADLHKIDRESLIDMLLRQAVYLKIDSVGERCVNVAYVLRAVMELETIVKS